MDNVKANTVELERSLSGMATLSSTHKKGEWCKGLGFMSLYVYAHVRMCLILLLVCDSLMA